MMRPLPLLSTVQDTVRRLLLLWDFKSWAGPEMEHCAMNCTPPPSMGTLMGDFYTCNTKGTFQVPSAEWPTYMCRDFCAFTTSSFEL